MAITRQIVNLKSKIVNEESGSSRHHLSTAAEILEEKACRTGGIGLVLAATLSTTMMHLKFDCPCGQPIEFDIEPVDGAMPYGINCPSCNQDCTGQANAMISTAAPDASPAPPPARPVAAKARLVAAEVGHPASDDGFLKGLIGALVASLVGMLGWFFLIKLTGYEIGYAAWAVGGLTGVGARVLGAVGTPRLGIAAGTCACVAIIGGGLLATRSAAEKEIDRYILAAYQEQLDEAQEAIAVNGPEATKAFIAKREAKQVSEVTDEEIKRFQVEELPHYQKFVASKTSKADFVARMSAVKNSFSMQWMLLKESIGVFTLLWLLLGVGTAYKLGAGTND